MCSEEQAAKSGGCTTCYHYGATHGATCTCVTSRALVIIMLQGESGWHV